MKFRFIGIIFIISGFATPFIPNDTYPVFLHSILPLLFFWSGLLLLFYPLKKNGKINDYLKWARYGIFLKIILSLIGIAWYYVFFYFGFNGYIWGLLFRILGFITNPIGSLFDFLMPVPMSKQPDGSVLFMYGFIRSLLTDFFNLLLYAVAGICLRGLRAGWLESDAARRRKK